MARWHIQSANFPGGCSHYPAVQELWLVGAKRVTELLLATIAIVAYGFAIAKLFQAATSGMTPNPPDLHSELLALLGTSYMTYLAHEADVHGI
jgi:hypothetical protein